MRGPLGCLTGCLTKLLLFAIAAGAFFYALIVAMNPWALHIGGRSTPLLYWHGAGTVVSKDGKTYPFYVSFWPGRPAGAHGGGRRGGKLVSARLSGSGWLCVAPGNLERMQVSGTMYGGYLNADQSLFEFRVLEWRKAFAINYQRRGFFDLAGQFQGPDLVMNSPSEQGIKLASGPFIDNATATLRWADDAEFKAACLEAGGR